ncbi:MAG TPA: ankyrin repeat domain-containing protein [bacterium]|nr:ankyrin repeat domain-containing protein [bacterium]
MKSCVNIDVTPILLLAVGLLFAIAGASCSSPKTTEALIVAIKQGNIEAVRLTANANNVNGTDETGATPIMWAAFGGNLQVIEYLIEQGADYNKHGLLYHSSDKIYTSALNAAVGENNIDVVKYFVERKGVAAEQVAPAVNYYELSPSDILDVQGLYVQLMSSEDPLAKDIKSEIVNRETRSACSLVFLIDFIRYANNFINNYGDKNFFDLARKASNRRQIDTLFGKYIKKKDRYDYLLGTKETTSLIIAVRNKRKEMVQYLLDKRANINMQSYYGMTALMKAAENKDYEMLEYLVERGATATQSESVDGLNVLALISLCGANEESCYNNIKKYAPVLVKAGADINHADKYGNTILSNMCVDRRNEEANFLVSLGADPDIKNGCGEVIRNVCKKNDIEILPYKKPTETVPKQAGVVRTPMPATNGTLLPRM